MIDPRALGRNADELRAAASKRRRIDLGIYFARKANKALAFVDEWIPPSASGSTWRAKSELEQAL